MPDDDGQDPKDGETGKEGQDPNGSGQDPTGSKDPGGKLDVDALKAELNRARREAAGYRKQFQDADAKIKEYDQSKLTDTEKAQARITELEKDKSQLQTQLQEVETRTQVYLASSKHGIVDPDAAYKLLDLSTLEYDDAGRPKNLDTALKDLVTQKPYLIGKTGRAGGADGGAGNDSRPKNDMNSVIRRLAGRT